MYTKSINVEFVSGTETSDAINEIFKSSLKRYQEWLETKMRGSRFTFERVDLLEYHLHKTSLNSGSSYIKSPDWLRNKGTTINPYIYMTMNALNMQWLLHCLIKNLEETHKEYLSLNLLSIIIIGKI